MRITMNLYYTGQNGSARRFMDEMDKSGLADRIRQEPGNLRYDYFFPAKDPETVMLIDSWENQAAIDRHHVSTMMAKLAKLRDKYDLHMKVERYVSQGEPTADERFIRK